MLDRLTDWTARAMLVFAAVLGLVLSFIVCADVIGRAVFNSPLRGTPEMVSSAIVIICFMQAPYAIRSGGMINVDFITQHLSGRWQSILACAGAVLGAALFAFIVWGTWEPALNAWTEGEFEGEGALRVPAWPARFTVALGAALAALNYLLVAIACLRSARAGERPPMGTGSAH
ncbi:MAG: TRAP transporter small permease [Burkholderiales bacterium]|nr:TRAP transporter small permease [Burkholderiales bacterium]